jgi:endoglucanase
MLMIPFFLAGCRENRPDGTKHVMQQDPCLVLTCEQGAIIRGDTLQPCLSLVFTGDEYADGGGHICMVLKQRQVKGSFFFTGNFYRNPEFRGLIESLCDEGHYLGAHSDRHLLYCDWERRDSLLVSRDQFLQDLEMNYREMERFGIGREQARYFLPPYEWYNDSISAWTRASGLQLVNFTPGTRSNADYTTPGMTGYVSSEEILRSIMEYEAGHASGLNGFIMLIHIGTSPERTDKFYWRLDELIDWLRDKGYEIVSLDELLGAF